MNRPRPPSLTCMTNAGIDRAGLGGAELRVMKLNVFLGVAFLLATLTQPLGALGQQNAGECFDSGTDKLIKHDWDGAIAEFSKAIELAPTDTRAYNTRGMAKKNKGDLDGAIADFSKAIELDPKDAWAYFNRGMAKMTKGDLDGAIVDCSKAIELNPKYAWAYNYRGRANSLSKYPVYATCFSRGNFE